MVNDQLLLRQSLPSDMVTPDVLDTLMADSEVMAAIRQDPEATIGRIVNAYQAEMNKQQYQPVYSGQAPIGNYPGAPGSGPDMDSAIAMLTQPVMPAASQQLLNQQSDFYRVLALAGGDFNPYQAQNYS